MRNRPRWLASGLMVAVGVGVIGAVLLQISSAATFIANSEAENGTVAGNAAKVADGSASGGQAVRFGSQSGGTLAVPSNLKAFAGGNSIALRWDGSAAGNSGVRQYNIFRNNLQIATVTPGFHADFPERDGNGYIDANVSGGQTYSYTVQAISTSGGTTSKSTALSVTQPSSSAAIPTVTIDSSAASDLAGWAQNTIAPMLKTWQPKVATTMGFTPISTLKVVLDADSTNQGATYTGDKLILPAQYFRTRQQDVNSIFYYMTYLSLNHGSPDIHDGKFANGSTAMPENMPNWMRYSLFGWPSHYMVRAETPSSINTTASYLQGSYRGAAFLDRIQSSYDPAFIQKLTGVLKAKTFNHTLIQTYTGKTLDKLWSEISGRTVGLEGQITGINSVCMDVSNGSTADNTKVQIWNDCNGRVAQGWKQLFSADGQSFVLSAVSNCAEVVNAATAEGSLVQSSRCNGGAGQSWKVGSNGSLVNVNANRCLQPTGGATTNGTQLEIATCNGSNAQKWTMPQPMSTPSGLQVYTGGNSIAINWNIQTSNPQIKHYNVYRNDQKIGSTAPVANYSSWTFGTQYIDQSVSGGQTYKYQIQAVDNNGNLSALSNSVTVTQPTSANTTAIPSVTLDASINQYVPNLTGWMNDVIIPTIKTWYPKISDMYARASYTPRNAMILKTMEQGAYDEYSPNSNAFASFNSGDITFNPGFLTDNPTHASSTAVHESTHTMQAASSTTRTPWITEGQARYMQHYIMKGGFLHPRNSQAKPNLATDYFSLTAYDPAAFLFNYIQTTYEPNYFKLITPQMHNGTIDYRAMQFSDGSNIDQAWAKATGATVRTGRATNNASGKCVDDKDGLMTNGNMIRLWPCNGATAQKLTVRQDNDGAATSHLFIVGKCLDVTNRATANGTAVQLVDCKGGSAGDEVAQRWTVRSDSTIVSSVAANKCLQPAGGSAGDGTGLVISDCNGSSYQKWNLP